MLKLILISFIFTAFVSAETYYVKKSGNDEHAGSLENPWLTIQHAMDNITAGDSVLVGDGIYNELVFIIKSGSEQDGYIVVQNIPGEKPVIDGTGLGDSGSSPGLISMLAKSYVKIIGFEMRNLITSDEDVFPAAIWVRSSSHHIEIRDNIIHNIEQHAPEKTGSGGAHGIAIYGTNSTNSIHDILIEGNEIYDCILGWSESLVLNGNVENFIVRKNVVHDNNNIAYDFIGHEGTCSDPAKDQARNGLVVGNIAYNIDARGNPVYGNEPSSDGFYVDGGKDIILERNLAYQCNIGFEIASEHGGKSTSGITIRNNYIYNNHVVGLAFGGYDSKRGSTKGCRIINNTLYMNNADNISWGAEILMQYFCNDNVVKNNIIVAKSGTALLEHGTTTGSNNLFDHNIYFADGSPAWTWRGKFYSQFQSYQSASGMENSSFYQDPKLVSPAIGSPELSSDSPAIDKGETLDPGIIGDNDFLGKNRIANGIPDIGAFEFQNATSLERSMLMPDKIKLYQNYPNPFNPSTVISYHLESLSKISIDIFNNRGEWIESLIKDKQQTAGFYNLSWNAKSQSSGVYYAVLKTPVASKKTIKMLLIH